MQQHVSAISLPALMTSQSRLVGNSKLRDDAGRILGATLRIGRVPKIEVCGCLGPIS